MKQTFNGSESNGFDNRIIPENEDTGKSKEYSRRDVLKLMAISAASLAVPQLNSTEESRKPAIHVYPDYGWLRGLGMVPSWAARIEDAWWFYDSAKMREEVALARQIHANCIRLWIEFTAWQRDPEKVTANFMDAVSAISENGMRVMPCLFNRWHDSKFDYGGTYLENLKPGWKTHLEYVKSVVTPLANDDRILIWDLCNEPQASDLNSEHNKREFQWLSEVAATVRGCGARRPAPLSEKHLSRFRRFTHEFFRRCGFICIGSDTYFPFEPLKIPIPCPWFCPIRWFWTYKDALDPPQCRDWAILHRLATPWIVRKIQGSADECWATGNNTEMNSVFGP